MREDEWGVRVRGKLEYYGNDLHAHDVEYHHVCCVNFRTFRQLPMKFREAIPNEHEKPKRKWVGRPLDAEAESAFIELCTFFDQNDEEQLTLVDMQDKMRIFGAEYSVRYLKTRLLNHYGDTISITSYPGKHV